MALKGLFAVVSALALALSGSYSFAREKCAGIRCTGHGTCVVRDGEPKCECDEGYVSHPDRHACVRPERLEAGTAATAPAEAEEGPPRVLGHLHGGFAIPPGFSFGFAIEARIVYGLTAGLQFGQIVPRQGWVFVFPALRVGYRLSGGPFWLLPYIGITHVKPLRMSTENYEVVSENPVSALWGLGVGLVFRGFSFGIEYFQTHVEFVERYSWGDASPSDRVDRSALPGAVVLVLGFAV
jgi:hypothetical protein